MTGKYLQRMILYLTNYLKFKPLGGDYKADYSVEDYYDNGSEFWNDYNNAPNSKYSYKWCLRWLKTHPNSNIWDDLLSKDPYLKACLDHKNIRSFDILLSRNDEFWDI